MHDIQGVNDRVAIVTSVGFKYIPVETFEYVYDERTGKVKSRYQATPNFPKKTQEKNPLAAPLARKYKGLPKKW